jgi:hypothetical protein
VLAVDAEALTARGEHAQRVTAADSARDNMGGGVEHVLSVVEHEEDVEDASPVEYRQRCFALSGEAERGNDGVRDADGVANLCELDEPGAERPAARRNPSSLDREPRLADATRADEGHDPRLVEESDEVCALVVATDEGRGRRGRRPWAGPRCRGRYALGQRRSSLTRQHHPLALAQCV